MSSEGTDGICVNMATQPLPSQGPQWWGEINLERSGCGENGHKMCEKRWKWVQLGENAISPMWKKHQNLLSNNNDAPEYHKRWVSSAARRPKSRTARTLRAQCA
jgi:hypothetical protein